MPSARAMARTSSRVDAYGDVLADADPLVLGKDANYYLRDTTKAPKVGM